VSWWSQRLLIGAVTLLGGIFWIGSGLSIWTPSFINLNELGPVYSRMVVSAFIGAILCVALGLLGLRQLYVGVLADKARTSFVVAFVGLLVVAATLIAQSFGSLQSFPLARIQGFGLTMLSLGHIGIGGAALHDKQHQSWQQLPLVQGLLGLFLPVGAGIEGFPGFVAWSLFGLGWCWLGVIMVVEHKTQVHRQTVAAVRH
jgi:hypothetical protein